MKRLYVTALSCLLAISLCFAGLLTHVSAATIALNKTSLTLGVSNTYTLKLLNNKKKVTWSSSKKTVAKVSSKGVVTGKKAGSATITAKANGKKYTCKVTVKALALSTKSATLDVGETLTLSVLYNTKSVTYATSKKAVATVSKKGVVTAKSVGTATITVKTCGKTFKATIKVINSHISITPSSDVCTAIKKYSTNTATKHYFLLRSYVEYLESLGGGTLTLGAGTYNVSNTIYIPSNVHIKLNNATILKTNTTGGASFSPSKSLFQFVSKSIVDASKTVSGYNGTHDASITGTGTIDMDYLENGIAVIIGHNKNITLEGITFKNMCGGHMIELDATDNCTIKNCNFEGYHTQTVSGAIKEAINVDTPDVINKSFNNSWSSQDETPDKNLTITGCTFKDLPSGIGTHTYSSGKRHTNITISNNTFTNIELYPVHMQNWSDVTFTGNTLTGNNSEVALRLDGVRDMTMKNNTIKNYSNVFKFYNTYSYNEKDTIYTYLSDANKRHICADNTYTNTTLNAYYNNDNGDETGTLKKNNYTTESYGSKSGYFGKITYELFVDATYANGKWTQDISYDASSANKGVEVTWVDGSWIEKLVSNLKHKIGDHSFSFVKTEVYTHATKKAESTYELSDTSFETIDEENHTKTIYTYKQGVDDYTEWDAEIYTYNEETQDYELTDTVVLKSTKVS